MARFDAHLLDGLFADGEIEAVVYGIGCRQREVKGEFERLVGGVFDSVFARKIDAIGRIPEQPLAAVVESQIDVDTAGTQGEEVFVLALVLCHGPIGDRGLLDLGRTPELVDALTELVVLVVGANSHGRTEHDPGDGDDVFEYVNPF